MKRLLTFVVALLIAASAIAQEAPRPIAKRGLENLVAFARLYGYVRFFHPSDEAAKADWEAIAIDGARAVEGAKNAKELNQKLRTIFLPLAPTMQIYPTGKHPAPMRIVHRAGATALEWRHNGFAQPTSPSPYKSERVKDVIAADASKPIDTDLGAGVSAIVPLVVDATPNEVVPVEAARPPPEAAATPAPSKYSALDRATRLADVIIAWNVLEHFYPYFDVVNVDWKAQLPLRLQQAATDTNETEFWRTLRRMVAALQDGHGIVNKTGEPRPFSPPIMLDWIENKVVVTWVGDASIDIKAGEIVESIDGKPVAELIKYWEEMAGAATPQFRRYGALQQMKGGPLDSEMRIEVRTGDAKPRTVTAKRTTSIYTIVEARPPKVHEIEPNIFYLDLTRMDDKDFEAILPRLKDAHGVIFDVRGYPRNSTAFLRHLSDKPLQSAIWGVPIVTRPDHEFHEWDGWGRWNLEPQEPRIGGKIAWLTDARAISYAESVMGIVEAYHIGEIVGGPTAGTNGNVNFTPLPGGYTLRFTGMRVLKHDGSRHHGIGNLPTVPVAKTIKGVTEKRDEQLEKALELVR